jgi:hypothetical protein
VRKKRKRSFGAPDSRLVGCGTVSTGKKRRSGGEYCLHLQDKAVEIQWIFILKIG